MFFLYSLGLSLYVNYITVCLLTWARVYVTPVIFVLFFIELCYYIFLYRYSNLHLLFKETISSIFLRIQKYYAELSLLNKFLLIFSIIIVLFFLALIPFSAGTSYYFTDAHVQYTRWPSNWAANTFPVRPSHYPQLFSTNLSIINIVTGDGGLRFFTKLFMPVFFISILLMFFDLAKSKKSPAYLAALLIYSMILLIMYGVLFILDVNADIPVSFFGFLTFYTILQQSTKKFDIKNILLVSVFAVSCANTKLAGFYMFFVVCLWLLFRFYSFRKEIPTSILIKTGVYIVLIFAAGNFWYYIQPSEMVEGLNQSTWLQPTYLQRCINAVYILAYSAGIPFFLLTLISLAASLFVIEARHIMYIVVLPASIVWMFFFSNDLRNYSFVIPYIAYCSAFGLQFIFHKIASSEGKTSPSIFNFNQKLITPIIILLIVGVGFLAGTNDFFNFLIKMSYTLNSFAFNRFRLVNTIEIGYYKYVEYYVSAIRLLCISLLLIYALRKSKIKIVYIVLVLLLACVMANFTFLSQDKIWQMQKKDTDLVRARNLQFLIYSSLDTKGRTNLINTNSSLYMQLVPSTRTANVFIPQPDSLMKIECNYQYDNNFILLQKDKLNKEEIEMFMHKNNLTINLDGIDFFLFRIIN
ncbi:MAG: hypothetical protein Q8903_03380 [Bacteroidota bacterium]|nr:hypothetical protein [Bacteroidota bacterium]